MTMANITAPKLKIENNFKYNMVLNHKKKEKNGDRKDDEAGL